MKLALKTESEKALGYSNVCWKSGLKIIPTRKVNRAPPLPHLDPRVHRSHFLDAELRVVQKGVFP